MVKPEFIKFANNNIGYKVMYILCRNSSTRGTYIDHNLANLIGYNATIRR